MKDVFVRPVCVVVLCMAGWVSTQAQQPAAPPPVGSSGSAAASPLPPGYVIGTDDILTILYWREKDMSTDAVVRPDGKISLPLLNDVQAAGLTPDELRELVTREAQPFVTDPSVTVVVKQINSRRIYITGQIAKPGFYPLTGVMTVVQLIAMAGGLSDFADAKHIVIMRVENGRQRAYPFNYKDVARRKNLEQNIELKPGDTIIVP